MARTEIGSAYGRERPSYSAELAEVGAGTPMGELLRRYWHPVSLDSTVTDTPKRVRVLGEDLILFRDKAGRPGLLYPRCAHRGTTLYYGKVEQNGIRCCYHGWLFDVQGHCLDQPCEPKGGEKRGNYRQPWYPLQERYGLVFAYLGPPERRPVLPRYECLEVLDAGEFIEADDSSIGSGGPQIVPCNWLQHWENVIDPYHFSVLHMTHSGPQFGQRMDPTPTRPTFEFELTRHGVKASSVSEVPEGLAKDTGAEVVLPTLRIVPNPRLRASGKPLNRVDSIGWTLPIDDTHYRIYVAGRVREPGELRRMRSRQGGKLWEELSADEHQKYPGDYEAQTGQGEITFHSEEHLVSSDKGIALLRRMLKREIEKVAKGEDPVGVDFAADAAWVEFDAGRRVVVAKTSPRST